MGPWNQHFYQSPGNSPADLQRNTAVHLYSQMLLYLFRKAFCVSEGFLTLGGEHTMQYTEDVL